MGRTTGFTHPIIASHLHDMFDNQNGFAQFHPISTKRCCNMLYARRQASFLDPHAMPHLLPESIPVGYGSRFCRHHAVTQAPAQPRTETRALNPVHLSALHPESKSLEGFRPDNSLQSTGVDSGIVFRMQGRYRIGGSTMLQGIGGCMCRAMEQPQSNIFVVLR